MSIAKIPTRTAFSAALALVALGAPARSAPQELLVKPAEIAKVSKKLSEWIQTKIEQDRKKEPKANEAFRKEFDRVGKKIDKDFGLLVSPPDLAEMLMGAGEWTKSEGNPGKVATGKDVGQSWVSWAHLAPKAYDPKDLNWPLVLQVLPAGEKARDWLSAKADGTALVNDHVVVATTLPDAGAGDDTAAAMLTLNAALTTFRVDHQRVYLSAAGETCKFAVELANRFPHRFAGLVLASPAGDLPEAENLGHVPIYLGDQAEAWGKALTDLQISVQTGEAHFDKVAEWLPNHLRAPYPEKIHFKPTHRAAKQSYWVRIEPEWVMENGEIVLNEGARPLVDVTLDRSKNQIQAKVERVGKIEFLFCDALVDFSKPITLEVNGRVVEVQKERDLSFFLEQFLRSGDRGSVFTASYLVSEIPADDPEAAKNK